MRFLLLLAFLSVNNIAISQEIQLPQNDQEWKAFDENARKLLAAGDFEKITTLEPTLRSELLDESPGHYLTTICVARALSELGRHADSLPYFEQALRQNCLEHNVRYYMFSIRLTDEFERGFGFLDELKAKFTKLANANRKELEYWSCVAQGDKAYLNGLPGPAKAAYRKAMAIYDDLPTNEKRRDDWMKRIRPLMNEYTYWKLYTDSEGWKRNRFLTYSFLPQKIDLVSSRVPDRTKSVNYRVAAIVVRNTDLSYEDAHGTRRRETNALDDHELATYQNAWRFAMDAVQLYSEGNVVVTTDWIDLEGATLTRLTEARYKDLIDVRHLDPTSITPPQDELYQRVVRRYDCVIFVWDRGRAAKAYGGGPISLKYRNRDLPQRGCVRSLPITSAGCMHEFLHNMTLREGIPGVHGIQGDWRQQLPGFTGNTDAQWYCYLVANIPDWKQFKYVR